MLLWWCFVALFGWGEFLVFDSCWLCNIDSGSYMVVCAVLECVDCLCRWRYCVLFVVICY